jgi:hypothetical protein
MMPRRIQLSRRKGYRKPEGAIVVTRPTRWGNPFRRDYDGHEFRGGVYLWGVPMSAAEDALLVRAFSEWLAGRLFADDEVLEPRRCWILDHLPDLRGHDLCCWCKIELDKQSAPCHADVLLELANNLSVAEVQDENIRRPEGETHR